MNGHIEVDSEKGAGSCFTITLHLLRAKKPEETPAPELSVSLKGKRILLAEDNEINAMIAKELLETSSGMLVEIVENGRMAVDQFSQSAEGYYDVILMDVRMPVLDGLEATREIRKLLHPQSKTIPIIAISANAFDEDVSRALACGMNAYLSKPIDIRKTIYTLADVMGGGQG